MFLLLFFKNIEPAGTIVNWNRSVFPFFHERAYRKPL
jgi:hypothetical protein